jgi:putative oxidoreductase
MTTFTTPTTPRPSLPSAQGKSAARPARSRAANAVLWTVQIAVALMFLMAGYAKLSGDPMMVGLFDVLGTGQWFRYVTGGIEVVAALLLLVPSLAFYGALLLIPTMIGAVLTHLVFIGGSIATSAILLIASAAIAWARRPVWPGARRVMRAGRTSHENRAA